MKLSFKRLEIKENKIENLFKNPEKQLITIYNSSAYVEELEEKVREYNKLLKVIEEVRNTSLSFLAFEKITIAKTEYIQKTDPGIITRKLQTGQLDDLINSTILAIGTKMDQKELKRFLIEFFLQIQVR
ncbi:MAG: hypothetical protein ACTSRR_09750 [Candidatus Heimdallarchaeaceae archaeon]